MKPFNIFLIIMLTLSSLTLTACDPFKGLRGYGQESGANGKFKGFKNARGGMCQNVQEVLCQQEQAHLI
ncbi:Uncharacterised protein [Moraxella lacunata]|uniref:Lipoprotein n=1 Tax=Moraxella lacunata TaxID=477 RepID=A0A378QIU8_MORLA|nr:hypothetical protein [Moraxella lacunata]STZ00678.1 Uncharacterised protein [Moraxella lacunata]